MAKHRTPRSRPPARAVTAARAARLYRLIKALASPQSRPQLLKRLKLDVRGFYRDLELLRAFAIRVRLEEGRYVLWNKKYSEIYHRSADLFREGVKLADVYLGSEGVLTGSARLSQEARERAAALAREEELAALRRRLDRRKRAMEAQILALRAEIEAEEEEVGKRIRQTLLQEREELANRTALAAARQADGGTLDADPTEGQQ